MSAPGQRARGTSNLASADHGESAPPPAPAATAVETFERETSLPSAEEVARRVYELFCQDLRRDRERRGRRW